MEQISFDPHQFAGKYAKPVSAETEIDFTDYTRSMSVSTHKAAGERRLPAPEWALNDEQLRSVLVRYMEGRAMLSPAEKLPMSERLERARKALLARIPRTNNMLTALCMRYVKYKTFVAQLDRPNADQRKKLKDYEEEIENLDTVLRMGDCAKIVIRVVYLYYRVPMDSVGVAALVHLKPPHVRQILWRLNQIAQGNGPKHGHGANGGKWKRTFDYHTAYLLRAIGYTYPEIGRILGVHREAARIAVNGMEKLRKEVMEMDKATIQKHYKKLKVVANRNGGKLPSSKTLEANGLFHSYDIVRMAGLLGNFDRVILKRGPKAA